jgi:hypothetical protein
MYEPAVARKPTTSATSSGRPIRLSGIPARIPIRTSSGRRAVISRRDESRSVAPPKLPGKRLCQRVHGRLLHRVGNLAAVPRVADNARYVDDPATVCAEHILAQDAFCQVPDAACNRTLCIKLLDPHPLHVGVEGDPGVVYENIEAVRLPLQRLHHRIDLGDVDQVRRQQESVTDFRKQGLRGRHTRSVMDPHSKILRRQLPNAGRSDSRCASRHHRHLFFSHYFQPLFVSRGNVKSFPFQNFLDPGGVPFFSSLLSLLANVGLREGRIGDFSGLPAARAKRDRRVEKYPADRRRPSFANPSPHPFIRPPTAFADRRG